MMNKPNKSKNNLLLLFLNPLLGIFSTFKDLKRDKNAYVVLYWWFILFGIGFCVYSQALDSWRYLELFNIEHLLSWEQYYKIVSDFFTFDSETKDIYTLTVNFIVGRFTDNYHWTFFIYAIVFGYFYIKSLKFLLRYNISDSYVFYVLLFIFCYSNPIFNINGVRFWTAAWIGVYVTLNVLIDNNYKKLLYFLLLPLIHGASIIWTVLLLVAFLTRKFSKTWVVLFVTSSFVSSTSFLHFKDGYVDMLPAFMQNMVYSYTESEMAQKIIEEGTSMYGAAYADFLMSLPDLYITLLSYILIFNKKTIISKGEDNKLFNVTVPLLAMTNFLSGIPSMGRFVYMVIPLVAILWAKNYCNLKKYSWIFITAPVVYAYSLLYWYRYMSSVTETGLYLFPAPISVMKYLFIF